MVERISNVDSLKKEVINMKLYELLNELNIEYEEIEHNPVYTIEEALKEDIPSRINGEECKNLFLCDREKNYYLVLLKHDKRADLRGMSEYLNSSKLSFASQEELKALLNLEPGSVTPLGIINDHDNKVVILIDEYFDGKRILVHPNINTKTMSLKYDDLIKIIVSVNHSYIKIKEKC